MLLTHLSDALLTVAYPQACLVCGSSVEQRRFGIACRACWNATQIFTGAETICWKCGVLSPGHVSEAEREEVRCRRCDSHAFTAARAVGSYEGALRESVLLLKRRPYLSSYLCDLVVTTAKFFPETSKIVPVPLHYERLRERQFNQARIIAGVVAKALRLPLDEVSLVRERGSEKYRAGLDPKGRRDTVAGAFQVRHPRLVAAENVLLVDDVFTTGATVNSCSEVLLAAGARQVSVLTVARGKS